MSGSRPVTSADPASLLALARDVAHEAGELLLEHAQRLGGLQVETKSSGTDPVSEADRASEALITSRLLTARPDDGIVGEEEAADRPGTSGLRWVVDPLDGTVNYLYAIPHWCVSVAVEDDLGGLAGVVHDPTRGETFAASRGGGAELHEAALHVRDVQRMDEALIGTGFGYDAAVRRDQGRLVADLLPRARDVRRAGAAALDLAWVAAGRLDAYLEHGLSHWDWAAGRLLVDEAGGLVTPVRATLGGAPRSGLLASGPTIHPALVARYGDWPG